MLQFYQCKTYFIFYFSIMQYVYSQENYKYIGNLKLTIIVQYTALYIHALLATRPTTSWLISQPFGRPYERPFGQPKRCSYGHLFNRKKAHAFSKSAMSIFCVIWYNASKLTFFLSRLGTFSLKVFAFLKMKYAESCNKFKVEDNQTKVSSNSVNLADLGILRIQDLKCSKSIQIFLIYNHK